MPANLPNNEILEDHVVITPYANINIAKERIKTAKAGIFECFNWWLCHKKLK